MMPHFTILGCGRVGRALADALRGVAAIESHDANPEGPVLLAVTDSAIETYAAKFSGRCAHMSGSLHIEGVPSLHPLISFDGSAGDWRGIPLAVTGLPPKSILDAFISLGFIPFELPPNLKPLYHACAVMASGHAATLWTAAESILSSSGISLPGRGLIGLAESTLDNVKKHGKSGITGPFTRRDFDTIQRDAQALPEHWRNVFVELGGMGDGLEARMTINSVEPIMSKISFWAKTTKDKESGKEMPGISVDEHMLNVGCVAIALLEAMPSILDNFQFSINDIAALVALHDLGKISPGFQRKCEMWLKDNNLEKKDKNCGGNTLESRHSKITQIAIHKILADMEIEMAGYIAAVLGAHHGSIQDDPETMNRREIHKMQQRKIFEVDWVAEWEKSTKKIIDYFGADLSRIGLHENSPELWFLAGLTTISDWIGSDENYFSAQKTLSNEERLSLIKKAVHEIGLEPLEIEKGLDFSQIFKFENDVEAKPNDIQKKAKEYIKHEGVYVIEAPMGMGKTEAALWAAYNLLSSGKAKGIYFALPTQTTSNRIHLRMKSFVDKIAPHSAPSRLIHSNSWLIMDDPIQPCVNLEPDDTRTMRDWFASAKRALVAPFGVGTIDQALKGVVAAKHFFVRHFALAGKVVIIDEVHSYDLYTGTLITKLVETLRDLGCTVIILSATLTEKRRNELLKGTAIISSTSYPLITGFSKSEPSLPIECVCDKPKPKQVSVCFKNELNAKEKAIELAKNGGVVLWVCNTVQSSQKQYEEIRECVGDNLPVGLLHARFPFWRRQELEDEWIPRLGKEDKYRCGCILVSTQIVEQSLDLDADLLITELAPTDMLFQRLGRLWRHERKNRHGRPMMIILEENNTIAEYKTMNKNEIKRSLGSKAKVYCPHVLLNSLEIWLQNDTITIPDQIRKMLELTYKEDREIPEAWEGLKYDTLGKDFCKKNLAMRNMNFWQIALNDKEESQTRLNEIPTISIVLCKNTTLDSDTIELLNGGVIQFKMNKFNIQFAKAIHKNLVKVSKHHFENFNRTFKLYDRLSEYLYGDFAIGIVSGEDNRIIIDGLKTGTSLQWKHDEGIIIKKAGGRT